MIPLQIGRQRRAPVRRVLRAVLWLAVLGGLFAAVVSFLFNRITRFVPSEQDPPALSLTAEEGVTRFGASSLVWNGGATGSIWTLRLHGAPYQLGYAHGALGNRLFMAADEHMFDMMRRFVPSSLKRWLMLETVRWRYRDLADQTPPAYRDELAGMAAAVLDPHRDVLPTYQRLLYYHATHEITRSLEHSPLLGCSAFAAFGPTTRDGHLIVGRNFDFEGGDIFDRDKAVLIVHPEGRIPFASVAWAGFAGVVTGINAEGIYVSVNAARTDDQAAVGMPVAFLAREVLEQAHTLDEAVDILKRRKIMVSDAFLVGDGRAMNAVVVEKSPTRFAVRRAKDVIWVTNHFLAQEFAKDGENDRLRRYLTSGYRYRRLGELLQGQRGLDPRRAQEILRDRGGVEDKALGPGNRNAIDAFIATHSVVVDATEMTLYVSEAPHTLGRYRAYDLRRELRGEHGDPAAATVADLPEDEALTSGAYARLTLARRLMEHAAALERSGERDRAREALEQAAALAPDLPDAHRQLGDLWRRAGDPARARRHYERFLELDPPYLAEVERVKAFLAIP